MNTTLGAWCTSLALLTAAASVPAATNTDFPQREISIVVGFPPGGSEDVRARVLAQQLMPLLNTSVIVVNRPGASGTIALDYVAKAAPDGYTIASMSGSPAVFAPHLQDPGYTPDDFTYLAGSANQPYCICVRADAPWQSMDEFYDFVRSQNGMVNFGHTGNGHLTHIVMAALAKAKGLDMAGIPYKGDADALTALLGGHIDAVAMASTFVQQAKNGTVRALAIVAEQRLAMMPEVPTLKEVGLNVNSQGPAILGYAAPRGLPDERRKILEDALATALQSQAFEEALRAMDNELYYRTGTVFGQQVHQAYKEIGHMIKDIGL